LYDKKCIICSSKYKANHPNRKYCYDCSPSIEERNGSQSKNKTALKKSMKKEAVKLLGGECIVCGFDRYISALEFHHTNPKEKNIEDGFSASTRSWLKYLKECKKCCLLCSNCHSAYHNKELKQIPKQDYSLLLKKIEFVESYNKEYCLKCGKEISKDTKNNLCKKCFNLKRRKVKRPQPLELAKNIVNNGFEHVGRQYGVSGNSIKKWCKSYNIPHLKNELIEWLKKEI